MKVKFEFSKYIEPLLTEKYFEADVYGGRGRGGSHGITQHCVFEMMTQPYFRGYLVRSIHGSIRNSLWQDFKDRLQELSELNNYNFLQDFSLNESRMEAVYLPNGNMLKSKGFKTTSKGNTAHMKSIAGATHIYGEEWEEVGQEENNKLMDSLRTTKGQIKIIRSWNPPPVEHWLVKEYFDTEPTEVDGYYKLKSKNISGHLALFGDYTLNAKNIDANTQARYERYKFTFPRYYWTQIKGYVSTGGDRKVYYGWQSISYADYLKIDGVKAYGFDFGDVSPCSLTEVKYKDGKFYRNQILYESLRTLNFKYKEHIKAIRERLDKQIKDNDQNNIWTKHKGVLTYVLDMLNIDKQTIMFCDPAQHTLIIELRLAGYNAVTANKDKEGNISFINRAENYYTENSEDLKAEYDVYYLDEDVNKNPVDGKPKDGQQDHAMHSQEYACAGLRDKYKIVL